MIQRVIALTILLLSLFIGVPWWSIVLVILISNYGL